MPSSFFFFSLNTLYSVETYEEVKKSTEKQEKILRTLLILCSTKPMPSVRIFNPNIISAFFLFNHIVSISYFPTFLYFYIQFSSRLP